MPKTSDQVNAEPPKVKITLSNQQISISLTTSNSEAPNDEFQQLASYHLLRLKGEKEAVEILV
jgi:hypothetical protein